MLPTLMNTLFFLAKLLYSTSTVTWSRQSSRCRDDGSMVPEFSDARRSRTCFESLPSKAAPKTFSPSAFSALGAILCTPNW
jgi:hypothetical protein